MRTEHKVKPMFCFVGALLILSQGALARQANCDDLGQDTKEHLKRFVRFRFGLRDQIRLQVNSEPSAGCFYRARVISTDQNSDFLRTFTITPDQKYVVSDAFDLSKDPAQEAHAKQELFVRQLAPANAPMRGNASAPVTLVVFSDFQCPYCKRASEVFSEELLSDNERAKLVFRQFPLPMHAWARQAAEASLCAAQQQNNFFWAAHDFLFENQRDLSSTTLIGALEHELKSRTGFDSPGFRRCVETRASKEIVDRDVAFGLESHVEGTPTVFVNGVKVNWAGNTDQLRSLVRQAARAASGQQK